MTTNQINYDELAEEALRNMIRKVLETVERYGGLPGDHHFYIAFDTQADGVRISGRLKDQYPEEMTVVLQHQFNDLRVGDKTFEVKLSFNNVPENLVIPFKAIKVFFDPSVPYALQFGSSSVANDEAHPEDIMPHIISEQISSVDKSDSPDAGIENEQMTQENSEEKSNKKGKGTAEIVKLDSFRKK